jgi:hypothetical protein
VSNSSFVRFAGASASRVPWRTFLSPFAAARKRNGRRRHGVAPWRANFPHGSQDRLLLPSVLPFTSTTGARRRSSSATPGELPSPKRRLSRRTSPTPSHPRTLSAEPYRPLLPGWHAPLKAVPCRDDVGLSLVNVVCHCVQVMPSQTPLRSAPRNRVSRHVESRVIPATPQGFSNVRNLAPRTGRIATPLGLSLPGSFTATRYQATLAAYPLRLFGGLRAPPYCLWRSSSKEFRTGPDPHGWDLTLNFPFSKSHHLP